MSIPATDLPPRVVPPFKLEPESFEVHSKARIFSPITQGCLSLAMRRLSSYTYSYMKGCGRV